MAEQKRPLYDSATFWALFCGACVVISTAFLLIGSSEVDAAHARWDNIWWNVGIGTVIAGALALLWALILFVAHRYAKPPTPPESSGLTRTENIRAAARQVRAEIATCRLMIEEAIKDDYYPWSSFEHKLPNGGWGLSGVVLAISPNARDAFHFAAMAHAQFDRINRLVTDMQVNRPAVKPEHRLETVVIAAETADHALIEFDRTLATA